MTGVTWTGSFPKSNYEVRFEAARLKGSDFFATLTFPVQDSFCTWVMGGWGGDIVGLSSLDGWDASDNETRAYFNFETGRWYKLRLQVTDDRITAWIDDERVAVPRRGGIAVPRRVRIDRQGPAVGEDLAEDGLHFVQEQDFAGCLNDLEWFRQQIGVGYAVG